MGENINGNGSTESEWENKIHWNVALSNDAGKYLSAEVFSYAMNASSKTMKKHQVWSIVPDVNEPDTFYLRSHLKRFVTSDKHGNVKCVAEAPEADAKFVLERSDEGNAIKWAFKSVTSSFYFEGRDDQLTCTARKAAWWNVTILMHPHVYLRRAVRPKYATLRDGELQCTENVPRGPHCLITLENMGSRMAIRSPDKRYLQLDGSLASEPALFIIEFRSGPNSGVVFRAEKGRCFLGCSGTKNTMKTTKNDSTCTKDEVFVIEPTQPQLTFRACSTNKYVSYRQTIDLSANQAELQDDSDFKLEFVNGGSMKWRLRDSTNRMWTVADSGAINLTNTEGEQTLFELHYDAQGRIALRAANGKFVTTMKNGRLSAASNCTELAAAGDNELFWSTMVNRTELAFQGDHGYIVLKNEKQGRLECNMAQYQIWLFEPLAQPGAYRISDDKGRNWKQLDDGFISLAPADEPLADGHAFGLRFRQYNKVAIRAPNGSYLKGEQNGTLKACASFEDAHLWEI